MSKYVHTLLATPGGQPQVVTFTLDLLLRRGFPISEVIVIHPEASHPRLQHSLDCLNAEFVGDQYHIDGRTINCHFRPHVLHLDDEPLADIVDDESADGTLDTLHHLICDLKRQRRHIHLSVTGGRRLMALLATSVAFLNFDRHDRVWHIYTPEAIQQCTNEGALMHVSTEAGVRLIESPSMSLGAYLPSQAQSFDAAQSAQRSRLDAQERARCKQVVKLATERQLDVLRAFAEGLNIQEVAERLYISTRTVDAHKTKLLELCREVWAIEQSASRLGYHFLYKTFAPYFDSQQQ
jgi:DNA-binding CsgD family transcriptional regulator